MGLTGVSTHGPLAVSDYIPLESITRDISARPNIFMVSIFDCCRTLVQVKGPPETTTNTALAGENWMVFAVNPGMSASLIKSKSLSPFTEKLCKYFEKVGPRICFPQVFRDFDDLGNGDYKNT